MTYSRMRRPHTTIGDGAFHVGVRDGIRWFHASMVARQTVMGRSVLSHTSGRRRCRLYPNRVVNQLKSLATVGSLYDLPDAHTTESGTSVSFVCSNRP